MNVIRSAGAPLVRRSSEMAELVRAARDARTLLGAARFSGLDAELVHARARLQEAHTTYVTEVSAPHMAISLELAAFLLVLCERAQPVSILDLGSGFSSFVFRFYASLRHQVVGIVSVDDSDEWLGATRSFVDSRGLPTGAFMSWDHFRTADHQNFDLIFHDLGLMPLRKASLPTVLVRLAPAGFAVLDDTHKRHYRWFVRRAVRRTRFRLLSLRQLTVDSGGRYSFLLTGNGI